MSSLRTLLSLALLALCIYLFVTAPAPLPSVLAAGSRVPIQDALALLAEENNVVRSLWTREIVGKGKQVGLRFDEDWESKDVDAGPLPALFLREISKHLEADPLRIGLFLGSEDPISPSNGFRGAQARSFKAMLRTKEPQFFLAEDIGLQTAMFPDYASAQACVDCHNEHQDSPRQDWALGDMMGATTWTYPKKFVTFEELLELTVAFRNAVARSYQGYLDKAKTFEDPPSIGEWPGETYSLPSTEDFMTVAAQRSALATLQALLDTQPAPR